jgi:polar amino acid transport system permease protein
MHYQFDWGIILEYRGLLIDGLLMTLQLAALSFVASILLGLITAIGRSFMPAYVSSAFTVYVEVFRNIPPIVQFFFWNFAVGLNVFPASLVALSVFTSTYIAEIIRSGIASIPKTQAEAARSSGMSEFHVISYVILPQAVIRVIPPLSVEFITLIKNSSIAMTIGLTELTFQTQEIEARSFRGFEAATTVTILYVLLALVVVLVMHLFERLVRLDIRKG